MSRLPQLVDGVLHGRTHRGCVAHVHDDRKAKPAQLFDLLGSAAKVVLGAERIRQIHRTGRVGDGDVCTFGGERQRMGAALTAGTSRDKRDATVQQAHGWQP
jgi:hypothetical protein